VWTRIHSARRRFVLVLAVLAGLLALAVGGAWGHVDATARPFVYRDAALVPPRRVAVVFGAKVFPDGRLSAVLAARVDTAVALYHAGRVSKLLMTGDNGRPEYDEVTAMKRHAVRAGVPPEDVVRDFAGFRTYDSCYRAKAVFGVESAVLVTQAFHLPRAVLTARRLGIDAVGLTASDAAMGNRLGRQNLREMGSRVACVVDVLSRRRPRFLGPPEPLFADERPDR
jgi:SanA protein